MRRGQKADPKPAATNTETMTDDEIIRMMFVNYRGGNADALRGLQLSQGGLAIMQSFFRAYTVTFPNLPIFTSRHILYLDRICTMPWSATSNLPITITFFEPDLAMRAKLVGDLDILIDAFTS